MPRSLAAVAIVVLTLSVAGCAADSADEPTPTRSASPSSAPTPAEPTPVEPSPTREPIPTPTTSVQQELVNIADRLGVAGFALQGSADYVSQWGIGTLDGSEVRIYEFSSEDQYLTYLDSVAPFGITADDFVRQGLFAVAPTDRGQIERITAAL